MKVILLHQIHFLNYIYIIMQHKKKKKVHL